MTYHGRKKLTVQKMPHIQRFQHLAKQIMIINLVVQE